MLCSDRIDTTEGIDINKTSASKECKICRYCYLLIKGLSVKHFDTINAIIY